MIQKPGISKREILGFLSVTVFSAAVWLAFLKSEFVGFLNDPTFYLEPARAVARGWGIVTRILYPAQVTAYPLDMVFPVRYVHHGPVVPFLIGMGYKAFGLSDWVPLAFSFGFTFLTGLALYIHTRKLAGVGTALTGLFLFWNNAVVLDSNCTALTDPLFILLITLALIWVWRSLDSPRQLQWLAAAGLAVGAASCTRLAGQIYWLGFGCAIFWFHRSWRALAAFSAGLILPLIPLGIYNHQAVGSYLYSPGFLLLTWSHSFPGFRSITTYMSLSTLQAFLAYPRDFALKAITGPAYAVNRLLEISSNPYFMACVVFGLFADYGRDPVLARFKRLAWIIILPVFAVNAVLSYGAIRYLGPLLPVFSIIAAVFIWKFVDEQRPFLPGWGWAGVIVAALFFVSPLALRIKDGLKNRPALQALHDSSVQVGSFVKANTRPDEVIYSDCHDLMWFADRPVVILTATVADAEKTFAHIKPDALVLNSQCIDNEDFDPIWRDAFYKKQPVLGFAPCREIITPAIRSMLFRRPGQCPGPATRTSL
ncbi:MAG: glycosyltransferase family 39 protein [Elusimicrobiota bacterium]|jgi:4-amino-4-deoxy-L-arabinose transferase-like glycosyltransferase